MDPDPTQTDTTLAYFWPAVKKRSTRLWLGYFLTQPKEIFFTEREKLGIFRGNFSNPGPNQRWLTQPDQQKLTQPDLGQKKIMTRSITSFKFSR